MERIANYEDYPENSPPYTPTLSSPANGATGQSLTPTLQASAFSDPDGDASGAPTLWQVDNNSNFSSPEWDSVQGTTSATVPSGRLSYSTIYYWRVKHADARGLGSEWSQAFSFTTQSAPVPDYTINLSANPPVGGMVEGAGTYPAGSPRTVMASAYGGYVFQSWTEGGTVVSTSPSYPFTLSGNRTLVANFAVPPPSDFLPIRINCGGGSDGAWEADRGFVGGGIYTSKASVASVEGVPQGVYRSERFGKTFSYNFDSVPDGRYIVRLHFAEIYQSKAGKRKFNVTVEDTQVIANLDIFAAAGGKNKAITRAFTVDVTGGLQIGFAATVNDAKISGIEVLPVPVELMVQPTSVLVPEGGTASFGVRLTAAPTGPVVVSASRLSGDADINVTSGGTLTFTPSDWSVAKTVMVGAGQDDDSVAGQAIVQVFATGMTAVNVAAREVDDDIPPFVALRVNCGGGADGAWEADRGFVGGGSYQKSSNVEYAGLVPQSVYRTERFGKTFSYNFDSIPDGRYLVRLHFAEIYQSKAGKRKFNVTVEDTQVIANLDIFAAAGGKNKAITRAFTVDVTGGLQIGFAATVNDAKISGIEVLPAGGSPQMLAAETAKWSSSISKSSVLQPDDILTSSGVNDSNRWWLADGDTNTVWQGNGDQATWWTVFSYDQLASVGNVEIDFAGMALTNTIFLMSVDAEGWQDLGEALHADGSVYLRYLWIIMPSTMGGDPSSGVRDIRVIPPEP